MLGLQVIYILNVLVAGPIAVASLANPKRAAVTVFGDAYKANEVMRLVGCFWLAITVLSIFGLWRPITFSPLLLLQLLYKGVWLIVVALPALRKGLPFPKTMALFFMVWVTVLPFLIPWEAWWAS